MDPQAVEMECSSAKRVNKRGQVRPKSYRSKYRKQDSATESVHKELVNSSVSRHQYPNRDRVNKETAQSVENFSNSDCTSSSITISNSEAYPQLYIDELVQSAERASYEVNLHLENDDSHNIHQPVDQRVEMHQYSFDQAGSLHSVNGGDGEGTELPCTNSASNLNSVSVTVGNETFVASNETQIDKNFSVFIEEEISSLIQNHKVEDVLDNFIEDEQLSEAEYEEIDASEIYNYSEILDDDDPQPLNEESAAVNKDPGDEVIYPGHHLPVKISVLLIWLYAVNHCITGTQLSDLLTLIAFHCIQPHPALKSLYIFKRYFVGVKSPLVKHYFCKYCLTSVNKDANICTNRHCLKDLTENKTKSYFLEIPVETQVRNFFQRKNFVSLLEKRFARIKKRECNIEDIYDSRIYRSLSDGDGPLSEKYPYNISFTLNTDGIPVFKSSKMSIWPIYLMINELPYRNRKQRENMILCGLWFGETKPFMPAFTEPVHKSLTCLEKGISVSFEEKTELCCAFLICLTADLPARSTILNTVQFNGQYSCLRCLQKGKNFRTEKGGNVQIFPYDENDPTGPERTKQKSIQDAHLAFQSGSVVNGMKGPSFVMALNSFDFVRSVSIDYMHCVLQGITKLLIGLWFGSSHSSEPFSLHHQFYIVDERLLKIKPPSTVSRMPRSITDHFKYWKASELHSWLLFYSVPILLDLMNSMYLYHFSAFVEAVYLLSGDSISEHNLEHSHRLLCFYVHMFQSLYGEKYYTLNLHSLLHLTDCVRDIGPLWVHSCFPFENANGELMKMFHGTQSIDLQIMNALNVFQNVPMLASEIDNTSAVYKFVCKMRNRDVQEPDRTSNYRFLGKSYEKNLTCDEHKAVIDYLGHQVETLLFYNRVFLNGQTYHSLDYTRVHVRNSFTVKYVDSKGKSQFGYVLWYALHKSSNGVENPVCCIKSLEHAELPEFGQPSDNKIENFLGLSLDHIHVLKGQNCHRGDIVHLESILSLCVCVSIEGTVFVCEEPSKQESNM